MAVKQCDITLRDVQRRCEHEGKIAKFTRKKGARFVEFLKE